MRPGSGRKNALLPLCLAWVLCASASPFIPTPTPAVSPTPTPTGNVDRPKLTGSELLQAERVVGNEVYEYTQMTLKFDQPLYLNEALLCAEAENPCSPNECVACDWTGDVEPFMCSEDCCGPAFFGYNDSEWCDPSLPAWETVPLNGKSATHFLEAGETMYFRFFVSDEDYCRTIQVAAEAEYGSAILTSSNIRAYPSSTDLSIEIQNLQDTFAYGQTVLWYCPNANEFYDRGTYSVGVTAVTPTAFTVEVKVSEQTLPLPAPDVTVSCDEVPPQEYISNTSSVCVEEGVTTYFSDAFLDFILPVPPGCHSISVALTTLTFSPNAQYTLYCLNLDSSGFNSLLARYKYFDNSIFFAGCFPETSFVHCNAFAPFDVFPAAFIWSTTSAPIRTPLLDVRPGTLSMRAGLLSAVGAPFGLAPIDFPLCLNFGFGCYGWVSQPTTDPLVFWPPVGDNFVDGPFTNPLPPDAYAKSNISQQIVGGLVAVDFATKGDVFVHTFDPNTLFAEYTLFVVAYTNEKGAPVLLPNDGSPNGDFFPGSILAYIPNIAYGSFEYAKDYAGQCSYEKYTAEVNLTAEQIALASNATDLTLALAYNYVVEAYNSGTARSSCVAAAEDAMESSVEAIVLSDQTKCLYDQSSSEWATDACCNTDLTTIECCVPYDVEMTSSQYTKANDTVTAVECGVANCANSYFGDFAKSLNTLDDPLTGCSSGVKNYVIETDLLTPKALDSTVRYCLQLVGLGDIFLGVPCNSDSDCTYLSTTCSMAAGVCHVRPLPEVETAFVACYLESISSSVENYLRQYVLPQSLDPYPRNSSEFFAAVMAAASVGDCVNTRDPLDLTYRTRLAYEVDFDECAYYWLRSLDPYLRADCPDINCLTSPASCLLPPTCFYQDYQCLFYTDYQSTPDTCPTTAECNVDTGCGGTSGVCAYCPPDGSQCTVVEGITSSSECVTRSACELPSGEVVFDMTAEACVALPGVCSGECLEPICRPFSRYRVAACVIWNVTSSAECAALTGDTGTYDGTECVTYSLSESECDFGSNYTSEYVTCESLSVSECDFDHMSIVQANGLRCGISQIGPCSTQEACESVGGSCSDANWMRNNPVLSIVDDSIQRDIYYGVCTVSGYQLNSLIPYCTSESNLNYGAAACLWDFYTCPLPVGTNATPALNPYPFPFAQWMNWQDRATNEKECVVRSVGRFGCRLPGADQNMNFPSAFNVKFLYNESDCECLGGVPEAMYTWTPGVWQTGTPRSLSWVSPSDVVTYEWRNSTSFFLMESWVAASVEQDVIAQLKSQLVCEENVIANSLSTLVCDCLAPDSPQGPQCYANDQSLTLVATKTVCVNISTVVKGPSSYLTFTPSSVADRCSNASLSLVRSSYFLSSKTAPAVSFVFANEIPQGVVVNENKATVGQVMGDGSILSLSQPGRVVHFEACLLIQNFSASSPSYTMKDFGYTTPQYDFIYPLNFTISVVYVEGVLQYWCVDVNRTSVPSSDGVVRLFPILRMVNYESQSKEYFDDQAVDLVHTLGACYCLDLVLFLIFLAVMMNSVRKTKKEVPVVAWIAIIFCILCIFRIVFCFLWPDGGFHNKPVAQYAVFEIPTFLLFSVVIIAIAFWRKLSRKSAFFFRETDRTLYAFVVFANFLVWSFFAIIIIVYAEKIIPESQPINNCPGRVAASNDQLVTDTHTLSVIYQSIVIFFTFTLGAIFWYMSYRLFKVTSKGVSSAKKFIFRIGAIIVSAFMLRCVLFIILLAVDFISDIYLFITLMITEVIMMFLVQLEFNKKFFSSLVTGASSVMPSGANLSSTHTASGARSGAVQNDSSSSSGSSSA